MTYHSITEHFEDGDRVYQLRAVAAEGGTRVKVSYRCRFEPEEHVVVDRLSRIADVKRALDAVRSRVRLEQLRQTLQLSEVPS